jgi:hypothetical protein
MVQQMEQEYAHQQWSCGLYICIHHLRFKDAALLQQLPFPAAHQVRAVQMHVASLQPSTPVWQCTGSCYFGFSTNASYTPWNHAVAQYLPESLDLLSQRRCSFAAENIVHYSKATGLQLCRHSGGDRLLQALQR